MGRETRNGEREGAGNEGGEGRNGKRREVGTVNEGGEEKKLGSRKKWGEKERMGRKGGKSINASELQLTSSRAISSNGFMECLIPSVTTPILSGRTRIYRQ